MHDEKSQRPAILISRTPAEFERLVSSPPDSLREALKAGEAQRDAAEANLPHPALDPNIRYT